MHHHRQRQMAPNKRGNELHKIPQHKTHQTATLQPRTKPNRTILEKHQTLARNKIMEHPRRAKTRTTQRIQKTIPNTQNIQLLNSYTIVNVAI